MVTGNAAVIPHSFLAPIQTIPATIAAELIEAQTEVCTMTYLHWVVFYS
jgi:ABC-type phosphate transport system permease subunit